MRCGKKFMALITWRGFLSACPTRASCWVQHRPPLVPLHSVEPQRPLRRRLPSPCVAVAVGRCDDATKLQLRSTFATHVEAPTGFHKNESTTATAPQEAEPVPRLVLPPRTIPARFVNVPFPYHHLLTLKVESLTNRGWGVGRVHLAPATYSSEAPEPSPPSSPDADPADANNNNNNHQPSTPNNPPPWVVLVAPGAIPGETVLVRIFRNFATYSEADFVQVLDDTASSHRIVPPCPVFGECGGCQYQHMTIALQREWKTRHVAEALHQWGIVDVKVAPCLGTDEIYGYRSKLTPHYEAPFSGRKRNAPTTTMSSSSGIREIGFQRQTSRQIVDVPSCAIATNPVNAAYQRLRDELKSAPPLTSKKQKGATLLLRQANAHDDSVTTNHRDVLTTTVLGKKFAYRAGNFFQNNYYVLPLLVQHVVEAAARPLVFPPTVGTGGDSTTTTTTSPMPTHLVDCYCGSGLFAISASDRFETVMGIEINDRAVEEATENAARNNVAADRCQFVAATAEDIFQQLHDFPRDQTVVVLDPPRKGCSATFLQQLWDFRPARIVYLSCDPVTQARDVRDLLDRSGNGDDDNGYEIDSVQPFDLFPQTRHIECLIVLNRRTTTTAR